jgi:hypothetical protein
MTTSSRLYKYFPLYWLLSHHELQEYHPLQSKYFSIPKNAGVTAVTDQHLHPSGCTVRHQFNNAGTAYTVVYLQPPGGKVDNLEEAKPLIAWKREDHYVQSFSE